MRSTRVWLFLAAYCWILIQFQFHIEGSAFGKGSESTEIAKHLAASGAFSDPFGVQTGPTAHLAPVYPVVIGLVLKVFGLSNAVIFVLVLLNASMLGIAVSLLPALSFSIYRSPIPGIIAAALMIASTKSAIQSEAVCSELLLIVACAEIFSMRLVRAGLWSGLAILANPVAVLAIPVIAATKGKRFAAAVLAIGLGITAPWVVRNWIVIGAPYFVRDNLGLELYVSNHDLSGPELIRNRALAAVHPSADRHEAELVRTLGERAYNQQRMSDAFHWIKSHPAQFARLTVLRTAYFWLPPVREGWQACGYWMVCLFSIPGFWIGRKYEFAVASVLFSLPYAFVQADVRYHYPALWMQALAAGFAIAKIIELQSEKNELGAGILPEAIWQQRRAP